MVKIKKVHLIAGVSLIVGIFAIKFISGTSQDEMKVSSSDDMTPVVTSIVESTSIENEFQTFVQLLPWKEIEIRPLRNSTVKTVLVKPGQNVKKGEVLVELDNKVFRLKKKLENIQMELQQTEFEAISRLAKKQFISRKEFQQKQMEMVTSKLRRQIAELEGSSEQIVSPIDGKISEINLKEGDYVSDPSKTFVKVIDDQFYKVKLHLPLQVATKLDEGMEVKLFKGDSQNYQESYGSVNAVSPVVDSKTGSVFVDISVDDPHPDWRAGMFAKLLITTEKREDILAIKNQSIIYEDQKPFVYRVIASVSDEQDQDTENEVEKVEKIALKLGISNDEYTEVLEGLDEDDDVVVEGQGGLSDQSKVEIVNF